MKSKKMKKVILYFLALLPISSIAFAVDYSLNFNEDKSENIDIEDEFMELLAENQLPLKYYTFLKKYDIKTSEQLLSDQNEKYKKRLIEEYKEEYKNPMKRGGGAISMF